MQQFKQFFAVLLFILGLVAPAGASCSQEIAEHHDAQSTCDDCQAQNRAEPELRIWPGCASEDQLPPSQRLCNDRGGQVEGPMFRIIRDALRARPGDAKGLCPLDAAVVWSYNNCAREVAGVSLMGGIVRLLAYDWAHLGELERADLLYARAYALVSTDRGVLGKMAVLKDWTHVKLQLGDAEEARRLAQMHTELAREYEEAQTSDVPPQLLINALLFQARILQELGLANDAQAAREEAENLKLVK